MSVTLNYIYEKRNIETVTLQFQIFITPHIGEAECGFIKDIIENWYLVYGTMNITSDNESDMCRVIDMQRKDLQAWFPEMCKSLE